MAKWSQWFYDWMYRFTKPDWDSDVTPPEVTSFVEHDRSRGRALDLGCGTGTNAIYLAQHGFDVTAIDFAPKAIDLARDKAKQASIQIDFRVGDVTRLDDLREPFDLINVEHGLNRGKQSAAWYTLTRNRMRTNENK